jgi:hypothetical protein
MQLLSIFSGLVFGNALSGTIWYIRIISVGRFEGKLTVRGTQEIILECPMMPTFKPQEKLI